MNPVLAFAAILAGAVVIKYGTDNLKTAFAASPSSGSSGSSTPASSTKVAEGSGPVINQVGKVLRAGGLNRTAAAGILGNAVQESSDNPAAVGDGGGGLWGFTSSPQSLADLQAFASQHGVSWTNPAVQAEFLLSKLSPAQISALNSQGSPAAAAVWFQNNWEHPLVATENEARRIAGAISAYAQLGSVYA